MFISAVLDIWEANKKNEKEIKNAKIIILLTNFLFIQHNQDTILIKIELYKNLLVVEVDN